MHPPESLYETKIRACLLRATRAENPELEKLWLGTARSYEALLALEISLVSDRGIAMHLRNSTSHWQL